MPERLIGVGWSFERLLGEGRLLIRGGEAVVPDELARELVIIASRQASQGFFARQPCHEVVATTSFAALAFLTAGVTPTSRASYPGDRGRRVILGAHLARALLWLEKPSSFMNGRDKALRALAFIEAYERTRAVRYRNLALDALANLRPDPASGAEHSWCMLARDLAVRQGVVRLEDVSFWVVPKEMDPFWADLRQGLVPEHSAPEEARRFQLVASTLRWRTPSPELAVWHDAEAREFRSRRADVSWGSMAVLAANASREAALGR